MDEQGSTGTEQPVLEAMGMPAEGADLGNEDGAGVEQPRLQYEETQTQTAQMEGNEPFDTPLAQPEESKEEYVSMSPGSEQPQSPAAVPEETKRTHASWNIFASLLEKARQVIRLRKEKKLAKIMALLEKHPVVTNDDVEKLLHVSDATATRYLSELEGRGRIKQGGKEGRGTVYIKA